MTLLVFASLGFLSAATVALVWWLLGVHRARRDAPTQVRWVCAHCGAMNLDRLERGCEYAIFCPTCYGLNEVVREG